jgi:hypothetical protein
MINPLVILSATNNLFYCRYFIPNKFRIQYDISEPYNATVKRYAFRYRITQTACHSERNE